ncbi:MICOS complex subunit MIC13-like [Ceratina calcarata]|uniref:MICOS complex subunit MIC13 n=1 Tax=Ceratina calcarata TaxID=156304 RepID=A0AAJ7J307_9HYME|nr:MICOS complex subunit MIC13-like [Ceratina calcarata]
MTVLLRFVIKSTIVGGVVYYTYQEGLWSKSEETAKLYRKLYSTLAPYVKDNIPEEITKEVSQLPSVSDVSSLAKTSWNNGVIATMGFLADLPTHTSNGASSLYKTVEKYMKDLNV